VFLFLLIIISSQTFLNYFVQMKQYEMEIFLSLAGIAQLIYLVEMDQQGLKNKFGYLLLCLSFIIAPFFSYTYPIVLMPVYVLVFFRGIQLLRSPQSGHAKTLKLFLLWLPLVLGAISIAVFYVIDVSQVLQDKNMYCFWHSKVLGGDNRGIVQLALNFWDFFGSPGSGLVFQVIFSILGIAALIFALTRAGRLAASYSVISRAVHQYALLLILVVFLLFLSGKLPLGEARLNAFTFPAVAILIVAMLSAWATGKWARLSSGLSLLLFAGLLGNVVTTIINNFSLHDYPKAMQIYRNTEAAIADAQTRKIPIAVTNEIAYPYDILHDDACLEQLNGASILKTFPAYKTQDMLPVYTSNTMQSPLPMGVNTAIVGDGLHYHLVRSAVK